ncbi:MAG TPA: pilin [Candidatus Paceibacterota bacterium]
MKKTLFSLFTTLFILFVGIQTVQAQTSCTTVTSSNYFQCCPNPTPAANQSACNAYIGTLSGQQGGVTPTQGQIQTNRPITDSQWSSYCSNLSTQGVNSQADYNECCAKRGETAYAACDAWNERGTAGVPGTVTSGTQKTTSPFTNQPLISGNPNVSPQSDSPELAACSAIKFNSLLKILVWVKCVITAIIIPLIFTLAFFFFLWNVFRFIQSSDKTNKEEAKERMWWGIIALFVMLSVWGIISILSNTLGITPSVPLLQTQMYLDPSSANKGK